MAMKPEHADDCDCWDCRIEHYEWLDMHDRAQGIDTRSAIDAKRRGPKEVKNDS
jgi:hypothetical protein